MKKILLLFFIFGIGLSNVYPQTTGIIKKITKTLTKKEASEIAAKELEREAIKKFGKNFTEKELRKLAINKVGKNFAERAVAEQFIKKAARTQVTKALEKEGLKSFLQYGNKKASEEIATTGLSATKTEMLKVSNQEIYKKQLSHLRTIGRYAGRTWTRIRITSKNQFLTKAEYLKRLAKSPYIIKNKPKDGGILRDNMLSMMTDKEKRFVLNKVKNGYQAHHIIGEATPNAKRILEKYGIDINDPMNGIFLPSSGESGLRGTVHNGGHTQTYYNYIEQLFSNCKNRDECYDILDKVKTNLYKGKIQLYNNQRINGIWRNKIKDAA